MNWKRYEVAEEDLRSLEEYNRLIPIPSGIIAPNAGVEVYSQSGNLLNAIYDANLGAIRKLNGNNPQYHEMPNRDILLYNDHLLNPAINTIVVDGTFGAGKTSTVCSHLVPGLLNGKIPLAYISKPHAPLGRTYGALPGEIFDKTRLEFQSFTQYFDRFGGYGIANLLMGIETPDMIKKKGPTQKTLEPILKLLVFEYLRGLDLEKGWLVLDEAQNCDEKEIRSIISRTGENVKFIIMGDTHPAQIDRKELNPKNNGLAYAKETYLGKKYAGYVEMQTVNHILRGRRVKDLFLALR